MNKDLKLYKKKLAEARRKGWWIACFYFERKIDLLTNPNLIRWGNETI